MPNNTVSDWSTTAASNTEVGGVDLAENSMRPRDVNNAIRTVMAQIATFIGSKFSPASASSAAYLDLHEDTDNGTNKVRVIAPASVASDKIATFQDVTGTIYVTDGTDVAVADGGTGSSTAAGARDNLSAFGVIRIQTFSASGTYTPHADMLYCISECLGAGGGGGGVDGDAAQLLVASGGGAGSYSRKISTAAAIGASQTVTIGAAGAGGTAGANAGAAGGDTSVGALCIGKGGSGGAAAATSNVTSGGSGGVAGTGDVTGVGQNGGGGFASLTVTNIIPMMAGLGGNSFLGTGGKSVYNTTGGTGSGFGSGGAGGMSVATATNNAGGAGTAGYVIVTEFCSQ